MVGTKFSWFELGWARDKRHNLIKKIKPSINDVFGRQGKEGSEGK